MESSVPAGKEVTIEGMMGALRLGEEGEEVKRIEKALDGLALGMDGSGDAGMTG
jgi:hypothetical protein